MPTRDVDPKALIATLDVDIARLQAEDASDRTRIERRGHLESDQEATARLIARADRQLAAARHASTPEAEHVRGLQDELLADALNGAPGHGEDDSLADELIANHNAVLGLADESQWTWR
jgi:hypothetical protein